MECNRMTGGELAAVILASVMLGIIIMLVTAPWSRSPSPPLEEHLGPCSQVTYRAPVLMQVFRGSSDRPVTLPDVRWAEFCDQQEGPDYFSAISARQGNGTLHSWAAYDTPLYAFTTP